MTTASLDEVVFLDFEFLAQTGERPEPICLVARTGKGGQLFRNWLEGKGRRQQPPFPTGENVLTVAYFASAELGCYLALQWPLPRLVVDLYAEFRVVSNGLAVPYGRGLLGAMQWFGLNGMEASKKDLFRKRILAGPPYSSEERRQILNYCQADVDALPELYRHLLPSEQSLHSALWRGEYTKVIAWAEFTGVPVEASLYRAMQAHWPTLQARVIGQVNRTIPVFEQGHFRIALFETWLKNQNLLTEWPRTLTGELSLEDDTFKQIALRYPHLGPLRQARQMLWQMRRLDVSIGHDGRNRFLLSPYATKTGRNAPSTTIPSSECHPICVA
jgi:hypothetical protein